MQSKQAKPMAAMQNTVIATQQTSTRIPVHHSGTQALNPPGAGLVTHRETIQVHKTQKLM